MKNFKRVFLKKFNIILVVLLGFLGFAGCSSLGRRSASTLENAEHAQKDSILEMPAVPFDRGVIRRPVQLYGVVPIDFVPRNAVPNEE